MICFGFVAFKKMNRNQSEWLLLLIILSYSKTCLMYLFEATTVFTVVTLGGIQIHLDDIILIWLFLYCIVKFRRFRKSDILASMLLIAIPLSISLMRGVMGGPIGSANFLSDTRKYFLFFIVLLALFFGLRSQKGISRLYKYQKYIHIFMNIVAIYVLVIWGLDLILGINSLPGQANGLLSDGGSTFRIINPSQVLMISLYTLYEIYNDLEKKKLISLRTLLFIVIVVLMQWRSVVAAFGVGLILMFIYQTKKGKLWSMKLFVEILGIIIVGGIATFSIDTSAITDMIFNLFESFSNVGKNQGTFGTRTLVWKQLLESLTGVDKLFGKPFGMGYGETVTWTASAHSGYVDYIMVTGYVGLVCLLGFIGFIICKSWNKKQVFIVISMVVILVYWYGYGFSLEQAALIGTYAAILDQSPKQQFERRLQ